MEQETQKPCCFDTQTLDFFSGVIQTFFTRQWQLCCICHRHPSPEKKRKTGTEQTSSTYFSTGGWRFPIHIMKSHQIWVSRTWNKQRPFLFQGSFYHLRWAWLGFGRLPRLSGQGSLQRKIPWQRGKEASTSCWSISEDFAPTSPRRRLQMLAWRKPHGIWMWENGSCWQCCFTLDSMHITMHHWQWF